MAQSGVDAVHVTICYHEDFGETVHNLETRNRRSQDNSDRIMPGRVAEDVLTARAAGKTAIFFGFQNCSPIEDDIDRVEIFHQLGAPYFSRSYRTSVNLNPPTDF